MKKFYLAAIGLLVMLAVSAQNVETADLHQPVNVNDAVVTGGVLRTQVLRDSLIMNSETGRMEKAPVVARRAAMRRASASDRLDYGDYYSGVAYYLYTFNYPSIDKHGNRIILSSLMAFPYFTESNWNDGYRFNNIVIGCHCTITSNKECPSLYPSGGFFQSDVNMMQYYASWGKGFRKAKDDPAYYNVLIMPDYEGYGVTKDRPHPYLYQELTARQVIDGVRYGIALFKQGRFTGKNESVSPQWAQRSDAFRYGKYFSIGASQGGSVAMAVQRFIEQNNLTEEFPFKGSICADGPYDPVATLKYYMKEDTGSGHKAGELTMPVAIALIIKGMLDTNPLMMKYKPTDFFTQLFLDTGILTIIADKQYPSLEMTTDDVKAHLKSLAKNEKYKNLLTSDGRANLEYVLTSRGWEYMTKLAKDQELPPYEEMNDLISALESNNLTKGWTPQHPICLFHSMRDTVVPYPNCVNARDIFHSMVTLYLLDIYTSQDHIKACTDFMFNAWGTSPDIKFIRTLFNYGDNQYPPYNN